MGIKQSSIEVPKRIMGVDCSTQSFAFSIFNEGKLEKYGEIRFAGTTVFHRLADGSRKVRALAGDFAVDMIYIEGAVYVQNKKTVILLSYAYGAILAALLELGAADVEEVVPVAWQRAIGNPPLTKKEKEIIDKANPGRSKSWLTNKYRLVRKYRTKEWVEKKFNITVDNDNVSDAIAIGAVNAGLV